MRNDPAIVPFKPRASDEAPILRAADHAIDLWRAAEASGDTALLESLRPLLTHIGRALAQDIMTAQVDETRQ